MQSEALSPLPAAQAAREAEKRVAYQQLATALAALLSGERDWLANLSQFAALIYHQVPDLNWAGFYLVRRGELVLGPFQGQVACVRIPFARGVCGAAARTQTVQMVADVHERSDHIACDAASRSELVVPMFVRGALFAVFDMDSPHLGRFDLIDAQGIEAALQLLSQCTDWPCVGDGA